MAEEEGAAAADEQERWSRDHRVLLGLDRRLPYQQHDPALLQIVMRRDANSVLGQEGGWPDTFVPSETNCSQCQASLSPPKSYSGQSGSGFLITESNPFKKIDIKVKRCLNEKCGAMYQVFPYDIGLFNICDKILLSISILLELREHSKKGLPLESAIEAKLNILLLKNTKVGINYQEIKSLIFRGYFCFEGLAERDQDSVVRGICPEVLDGNEHNCSSNSQVTIADNAVPKPAHHEEKPKPNDDLGLDGKAKPADPKETDSASEQLAKHEVEVMRSDPNSPLYSVKSFKELLLPQNMIVQVPSGTGKTAAFVLTMLSRVDATKDYPQVLCLSPTYELVMQTGRVLAEQMSNDMRITFAVRGHNLQRGQQCTDHIIIGTPGTVRDWIRKLRAFDPKRIHLFVLDEADIMISIQGCQDQCIRVQKTLPQNCQTLVFSATYGEEVMKFAKSVVSNAIEIGLEESSDNIKQHKPVQDTEEQNPDDSAAQDNHIPKCEKIKMAVEGDDNPKNNVDIRSLSQEDHKKVQCDQASIVKRIKELGMSACDTVLKIGSSEQLFKVTWLDLLTLLSPGDLSENVVQDIMKDTPGFHEGWLTDNIIESILWPIPIKDPSIFVADTTLCQVVKQKACTRLLWKGIKFENVEKILIPMNITGEHWVLFVLDSKKKRRIFIDPVNGKNDITPDSNPSLHKLLNDISKVTDSKTGWKSTQWDCNEPAHFQQKDSFNCGVLVCLFAKCLSEGKDLSTNFNLCVERQKMLSNLLGSCYNDVMTSERNVNVCKICKMDYDEELLGCDKCTQAFHNKCIGVNYSEVLSEPFFCP